MANRRSMSKNADGSVTIRDDLGQLADGEPIRRQWDMQPGQVAKHLATFQSDDSGMAAELRVPDGDKSAAADFINEYEKQRRS